jgi:AraC-like DNA-binding protein
MYNPGSDEGELIMHATEFVESYFDAWNHRDPKGVADHLSADGIYCDIPENARRSHDELIVRLRDFFSKHRHRYELIGDIMTSDNTVAFQYEMVPPGKGMQGNYPESFRGAEFVTLHHDEAMTIIDYYDVSGMGPRSGVAQMPSHEFQQRKYAKSGLSSEQMLEYKNRLEQIMQSQQVFLMPDLTLPKLAKAVNCSVNHLSQVINSGFGMSFFDYLNQYRIDHAREILTELNGRRGAVLNVAFTVGFNSNSAFYSAFKKCVGETPAQYRRSQLKKIH